MRAEFFAWWALQLRDLLTGARAPRARALVIAPSGPGAVTVSLRRRGQERVLGRLAPGSEGVAGLRAMLARARPPATVLRLPPDALLDATPAEQDTVAAMLRKIDILPLQVRIDAPIAEVTLNAPQYHAAGRAYGPPGAPFESRDELRLVLGMTPALYARLRPHLSVWWEGAPDPALADPTVAHALAAVGAGRPGAQPVRVAAITAAATASGGAHFVRRAVVRLDPTGRTGLFRILTRRQG